MRRSNKFYEFKMVEILSFSTGKNTNAMRTLKQSVVYKMHTSTRILGYNNTLLRASEKGMKFCVNGDLIYLKPIVVPIKAHQPGALEEHVKPRYPVSKTDSHTSGLIILGVLL